MQLPNCSKLAINRKNDMKSSSNFFDVDMFFLSILVTDPSFMSISLLVLEFGQFTFDEKSENWKYPFEFCTISGDWDELKIQNLAQISLIKSY